MSVRPRHEIRDPVHGLIRLTDQEIQIIDSPPFQRLRRIKQLAMADLVYPGALHTRFEHSLGTLHAAASIMTRLPNTNTLSEEDERIVRIAALLHDIGHGPFSHVSEYLLEQWATVGQDSSGPREKIHERVTVDIISNEPSISGLLSEEQREAVCGMIRGSQRRDARRDIVSSDLDADKIDYLSRDAYYTGVKYGVFDLDKVYESFIIDERGGESFLSITEEGLFAVEQLILAKHHMTQQVYAHRVRVITDFMIVRGLELAIEDGLDEIKELFSYDGTREFIGYYITYHDNRVFDVLMNCSQTRPKLIFRRLWERRLFKEIVRLPLTERYVDDAILLRDLMTLTSATIKKVEESIAQRLKCEPWEVIVQTKNVKNPAYQDPASPDIETVYVLNREGSAKRFDQYDEVVIGKRRSFHTLHVVAPYVWPTDICEKELKNAKTDLQNELIIIIKDAMGV